MKSAPSQEPGTVLEPTLHLKNAIYLRKEEPMFEDNFHQEQTKVLAKGIRQLLNLLDKPVWSGWSDEDFEVYTYWESLVHRKE